MRPSYIGLCFWELFTVVLIRKSKVKLGNVATPQWPNICVHMLVFPFVPTGPFARIADVWVTLHSTTVCVCATACLSAWVWNVYICLCEGKTGSGELSTADRWDAWLHLRGSSCVVRLMRLVVEWQRWFTPAGWTVNWETFVSPLSRCHRHTGGEHICVAHKVVNTHAHS